MKDFHLSIKKSLSNNFKPFFNFCKENLWIFPLAFLFLGFLNLTLLNKEVKESLQIKNFQDAPVTATFTSYYPVLNKVLGDKFFVSREDVSSSLDITAQGAIIMDDESKVILFSKNTNLRFSTASTAKIMTALVGMDYFKEKDILTVFQEKVEGSNVGFKEGEKVFFEDLLYGLLLPSGNDAAYAIAQNYNGGIDSFVIKMNEKAKELDLLNTHFSDPAGLLDDEDYTTVLDLARLSSVALRNENFRKVVGTKNKFITDTTGQQKYFLSNLNKLLNEEGVTGIKTGFTEGAGGVLTTSKNYESDGKMHRLIIVVMKSEDRFLDTQKILDYLSSGIEYKSFSY